jgi:hypothetical protein
MATTYWRIAADKETRVAHFSNLLFFDFSKTKKIYDLSQRLFSFVWSHTFD